MGEPTYDDDPLTAARRKRRAATHRRRLVVAAALFGASCVFAGVAVAVARHRLRNPVVDGPAAVAAFHPGLPDPADEGVRWTHADLTAYLAARGVRVEREPVNPGYVKGQKGPVCRLTDTGGRAVLVQLRATAADAREEGGTSPAYFVWGRFLMWEQDDESVPLARSISKALTGR